MLKTSSKTDDITKFDTGLRFRTLLICNPAAVFCPLTLNLTLILRIHIKQLFPWL